MVSAVALIKNKTGKQTRPRRSSVIDGERNAEAEKERSARSCQGSGSRSVPGRARGAQPTRSPRGSGAPAKPVPRQPRVWPSPLTPGPCCRTPPSAGTHAGRLGKLQTGAWRGALQPCGERFWPRAGGSATGHLSRIVKPGVLGDQRNGLLRSEPHANVPSCPAAGKTEETP